ncbi:MAG TPA: VOC family protein, partial [Streptosporangiaceae bacterium]|nr:VOC family protein [Streptosporangiaceae bacterium]
MTLHRLTSITMGVPNVAETAAYYTDFGLEPGEAAPGGSGGETWFSTRDGGRQLRIVPAPTRRLVDLHVGVDDADDLDRAAGNLQRLGVDVERGPDWISAVEKTTGARAYLEITGRLTQDAVPATPYN